MNVVLREYRKEDIKPAIEIWNEVIEEGLAFPYVDPLDENSGDEFFSEQTYSGVAIDTDTQSVVGVYILHPNNIGRCGHLCNASYAVRKSLRGQHIGRALVLDCIEKGREYGFRVLQFNAVVASNHAALHLYKKLGFTPLGTIPKGFLLKDGTYEDIIPHYIEL